MSHTVDFDTISSHVATIVGEELRVIEWANERIKEHCGSDSKEWCKHGRTRYEEEYWKVGVEEREDNYYTLEPITIIVLD